MALQEEEPVASSAPPWGLSPGRREGWEASCLRPSPRGGSLRQREEGQGMVAPFHAEVSAPHSWEEEGVLVLLYLKYFQELSCWEASVRPPALPCSSTCDGVDAAKTRLCYLKDRTLLSWKGKSKPVWRRRAGKDQEGWGGR